MVQQIDSRLPLQLVLLVRNTMHIRSFLLQSNFDPDERKFSRTYSESFLWIKKYFNTAAFWERAEILFLKLKRKLLLIDLLLRKVLLAHKMQAFRPKTNTGKIDNQQGFAKTNRISKEGELHGTLL